MNKATYEKLAKNPHYKMSMKQEVLAQKLNVDIHTQQLEPEDLELITFRGKREPRRSKMSTKKNHKKAQ